MANTYPNLTRAASRFGVVAFFVLVMSLLLASCVTTSIDAGHRGVKFDPLGGGTDLETLLGEGLQFKLPWQQIIEYEVRFDNQDEQITALSSNGAQIGMDISVRYRPDFDRLPLLHQQYGRDYYAQLVQPEVRAAAREVVGRYTPEDLYSNQRDALQEQIAERLRTGVDEDFVTIDAVLIRDVTLPDQVLRAIEEKLQEEQRVERASFEVQRAAQEAERKRVEAQGDADRARIITENLTDRFLQFQGIQATRELAQYENAKVVIIGNSDGLPVILGDN
jgi:regulator of protease activity HflC (stomatin/prohibitin superfamily)